MLGQGNRFRTSSRNRRRDNGRTLVKFFIGCGEFLFFLLPVFFYRVIQVRKRFGQHFFGRRNGLLSLFACSELADYRKGSYPYEDEYLNDIFHL